MKHFFRDRVARAVGGMVLAAALSAPAFAFALSCDARAPHIQFARDNLRRAASEGDLPTAQDYADRARRQLEQLARGAERCGCAPAQPRFEAAAAQLRKARDAESRRQVRDIVGRVLPQFEEAMAVLRGCAAD